MRRTLAAWPVLIATTAAAWAGPAQPIRARKSMVVSQSQLASEIGAKVLEEGGSAVDAAVATAFALAVVHPIAGNVGGGGFLILRRADGTAAAYDFREKAPAAAHARMFLDDKGKYDEVKHHDSHLAVGVPGTVAGLHLAFKENGKLPWRRLVEPAIALARDGFPVSDALARSLKEYLPEFKKYKASLAQFSKNGTPYAAGDVLRQPDLARTLERIAQNGPAGFYEGETAALVEKEMKASGGILTAVDMKAYEAKKRVPLRGSYRGHEVLSMPPPSSGGPTLLLMLNILEGYDLKSRGAGSAAALHVTIEAMRRAYADRAPRATSAIPRPTPICRWTASSRRTTRRRCARPSARTRRPARARRRSSGRRRATRPRTCRWWTRQGTP
jgi:gamma-glutamyltranspeptidase/glutathione hydrolase